MSQPPTSPGAALDRAFLARLLLIVAVVVLLAGFWQLAHPLLILFAGILLAILFRHFALPLHRHLGLPTGAAVVLTIVVLVALLLLGGWAVGPMVIEQLDQLLKRLPSILDDLQTTLDQYAWGRFFLDTIDGGGGLAVGGGTLLRRITGAFSTIFGVLGTGVIVLMIAVFLAMNPGVYRDGALRLLPPHRRPRGYEVLDALDDALWHWLLGIFVAMLGVGLMTGLGLWLLDIPFALALAVLAGLFDFIPFLGPVISAVPAILVGLGQSPQDALYVLLLFVGIQQIEGNLLVPMIQRRAVHLPPAVTIAAVLIFGVLFGLLGFMLATPLAVVVMVLIQTLYIQDVLGDRAR